MSTDAPASGFAKLGGQAEIAYEIHGGEHTGVPVVLIRPLGGTMALWGRFRAELSTHFRVISFDSRGSGRSSPAPTWVSTRGLARDTLGVLAHLGIARAHVFGVSLGGMAASWLAALAPERVARLCIAAAPVRGLSLTRGAIRRDLAMAACFARPVEHVEAALVARVLSSAFRETHPLELRRIEEIIRDAPASRLSLLKHAVAGVLHDATSAVRRIQAPTLVLAGQSDALLGSGPPRALSAAIPQGSFAIIADAGHDLTLEQPTATATRVDGFFRSRSTYPALARASGPRG